MKKAIIAGTSTIQFTFEGLDPITFDANKCSEENNDYAVLHGYMARLGDAAALSRTLPNGTVRTITEEMRREAVQELVTFYESGTAEWDMKRKAAPQNPAILALATKLGKTYAETQAYIAEKAMAELGA
jgi:hypothetical protein